MTAATLPTLVLELGEKGGHYEFNQPLELQQWLDEEFAKWHWMSQIHEVHGALSQFAQLRKAVARYMQLWTQQQSDPLIVQQYIETLDALKAQLEQGIQSQSLWLSSSPIGAFLLKLKAERHPLVAAGAYLALGGSYSPQPHQSIHPFLVEGIFEGFLFKREIDWTATTHREALEKLKRQYSKNLADQKRKLQEIEKANLELNSKFDETLQSKEKLLDGLHVAHGEEFQKLIEKHEINLKSIEDAYDQKLALLKPVKYWNARKKLHAGKAKSFAKASGVAGAVIVVILGVLAYWFFFAVLEGEKPKVWQFGVFSVAAFFSVWLERILVRLFISNMHLTTDAEERVTMLQTYLSIIREGSEFAPEDKKLILERLFHPAADGLVKDDGAPPTPMEILTRR